MNLTQAITWTTTFSGSLSAICSFIIVYMMYSDHEHKLKKPNNRLLTVMSIIDIFQSIAYATSALPMPKASGKYGAIGNHFTCSLQGFFYQMGMAVPCYNASLCIWYLMSIKYNMRPDIFRAKVEPFCHAVSILLPLGSAIALASLDMYGDRRYLCWIKDDSTFSLLLMLLTGVLPMVSFLIIVYCLGATYHALHSQEIAGRRYSTSPTGMNWRPNVQLQVKKQALKQGLLFSFAFIITFLFPGINLLYHNEKNPTPFSYPRALFLPLQGFWNLVIYARPTIERIKEEYPELSFKSALQKMIFHPEEVRSRPRRRRRSSLANRVPAIIDAKNGTKQDAPQELGGDDTVNGNEIKDMNDN
jgi:hypothetical protein